MERKSSRHSTHTTQSSCTAYTPYAHAKKIAALVYIFNEETNPALGMILYFQ
jgi:hypothetical protein